MRFLPYLLGILIVFGLGSASALAAPPPPTVSIASPAAGATVSGTITVSGTASGTASSTNAADLAKVELAVDNGAYQLASGTSSWSKSLNTTTYANGSHTLTARATDTKGNQSSVSRTVTISNGSLSVSISSPAAGATVSGTITVSGAVSGASKVELKVDSGAYQLASGTSSWSISLNTTTYANGSHTLTARATSSTGTQVWATRTVTISNITPPPPLPTSSIYWGALIEGSDTYGSGYGDAPWDSNTWNKFETNAGKKVSILAWGTPPPWQRDFNYFKSMYEKVRQRGQLTQLNMNSGSVPLRDIAAGKYDASIRTWAQQAAAWGYPFFLRWNWEMNGGWFPWGTTSTNQNTPSDFINSWRRFHDLTVQAGATNITWVWCPNIDTSNSYPPYSQLYPGNSYVDWTCLDGYNQSTRTAWQSFATVFKSSYDKLLQVAPTKPIMIAETGSEETGGSKASWITDALSNQLPKNFPRIEALVWFNWRLWQYGYWRQYHIESSSSSQSAFKNAIASSYYRAGGGFANLPRYSKIQPLP